MFFNQKTSLVPPGALFAQRFCHFQSLQILNISTRDHVYMKVPPFCRWKPISLDWLVEMYSIYPQFFGEGKTMSTLIIFWYKFTYSYHIHWSGSMSGYSVKPLYFGRTRNVSINALVASWLCFGGSWNIFYFLKWTCLPIIPKFDLLKAINISVSGSKKKYFRQFFTSVWLTVS